MSLKLIRNAILATTTNPEILIAEEVKAAIKGTLKENTHPSLQITKLDYDRWMSVAHDVAKESNMVIRNKTELADIVMSILDNDPKIESQPGDKEELKIRIINTMWNAHKATLAHVGVEKHVTKAREEEEMSGFAQDVRSVNGIEDEQKSGSFVKSAVGTGQTNPYQPGTLRHSLWQRLQAEENEEFEPEAEAPLDDETAGVDDESAMDEPAPEDADSDVDASEVDTAVAGADEVDPDADVDAEEPSPEEVLAELPTEDLEAELARRREEEGSDEEGDADVDAEAGADVDAEVAPADDAAVEDEPVADAKAAPAKVEAKDESPDDIAKRITFDDEQEVKSFFRHALTRPSDEMKAAMKDIEKEGQEAWRNVNLPKNPHPPKSQAYRAWNKGLTGIAKAALGIKDPKPLTPAKKKR